MLLPRSPFARSEGSTLKQDDDANKALYGKTIDATEILTPKTTAPKSAAPMIDALTKYSPMGK
jgi:lipid-binding SYLF domain-containing protein